MFSVVRSVREEAAARVKDNTYVYTRMKSTAPDAQCVVAHMVDGSSMDSFPEVARRAARP
jgi:hypothetical protein